jgi:hypothetical protein
MYVRAILQYHISYQETIPFAGILAFVFFDGQWSGAGNHDITFRLEILPRPQ